MKISSKLEELLDCRVSGTVELVPLSDYELGDGWMRSVSGMTDIPAAPGWVWILKR